MNWTPLNSLEQLQHIFDNDKVSVIFKHSTRCPVSSMAKRSLEFDSDLIPTGSDFYYLDLIANRDISNKIVELWNIKHESPQILIVKGNTCLYNASHSDIEMQSIIPFIS